MPNLLRYTVTGDGWPGAPSINQYYFLCNGDVVDQEIADDAWDRVRAAWEQLKTLNPNYVTHDLSRDMELLNFETGQLQDVLVHVGGDQLIEGVGTGLSLPPAAAMCLNLNTDNFIEGRKVRGRSFISPISQGSSDADGTPTAAAIAIVAAVSELLKDDESFIAQYCVWSRPREASEGPPVVEARDGAVSTVKSITMPNQFATLRSRRD